MFLFRPCTCRQCSRSNNYIGSFRLLSGFLSSYSSANLLPYVIHIKNLNEAYNGHKEARKPGESTHAVRNAPNKGNEADNTEDDGFDYSLFHGAYF